MQKYVMEFIGTFFLVLAIGLTGNPVAIGAALAILVYMGGHISGAHYNPAVTIALWIRGACKKEEVPGYIITQILAAFASAAVLMWLGKPIIPAPAADTSLLMISVLEILFTFTLAFTILTVATSKKLKGNHIYGLAIGIAVMVGAFAAGPISGGVLNPAVALGPLILQAIMGNMYLMNMILYVVAPTIGAIFAAKKFMYLNPKG